MNNINLTKEEFDKLVKSKDLEVYTQAQVNQFITSNEELFKSAEIEELDEIQKSEYETVYAELKSLAPVTVYAQQEGTQILQKSTTYVRERQVAFDEDIIEKSESGEDVIVKAKSGVYINTALNRKLGRVGAKYGSKKESADEGDGKGKSSKVTKDDIKSVSMSSNNSGGFTLNVTDKKGNKKHFDLSKEENARIKNSPIQHPNIKKDKSMWDVAVEKMNSSK